MYGAISGIEAAAETAAKLDASLNVKKKNDASDVPKAFFKNTDVLKIIQAEYSINHCSQAVRNLLCKGATQEKIREYCEAYVSTKGRYIPESNAPVEKSDKAFGLYLFIQGPNKRSVDLAIAMIENIISTGETRPPSLMSINTTGPPPGQVMGSQPTMQPMPPPHLQNLVQMQVPPPAINMVDKVQIGIDRALPGFNLPMKLIGQNGLNLHYIKKETGAVVTLRGIGSAFIEPTTGQEAQEPLHFCIEHSKPEGLATARELVVNLITTVQQEYAQSQATSATPVVSMDPNMLVQQQHAPIDQQMMHQPMLATAITLPMVQTTAGFIQQPSVSTGPPPQFTHPPPPQLNLPPPGIHIPPQQGPLVPPGPPPQQIQMQQPTDQGGGGGVVQQQFQPGQQQYLITQSGQPVQGIMTSQGFVVLNQQPQQVFLSQPPGHSPHVIHQGQLAFQTSAPSTVNAPVSYQLQYVQSNVATNQPAMTGTHMSLQGQPQQHTVVLQPPGSVQLQNGTVHLAQQQVVGLKQNDQSSVHQQLMPPGQVVQVKSMPQTVQVVQPYSPSVQYISSPGVRQDISPHKEPRLGKRKFTDEAEPQISQQPRLHSPQINQQAQMIQQQIVPLSQQLMQPPPQYHTQQVASPQPVPHPNQTHITPCQTLRQGVGIQDLMGLNNIEHEDDSNKVGGEQGDNTPPGPGNQYVGQPVDQQKTSPSQWFEDCGGSKGRLEQGNTEYVYSNNNSFPRRDQRQMRERPTFNHYSSKPQMYGYQSYIQPTICPPPPPPPPPGQHQHQYYYHRRQQ